VDVRQLRALGQRWNEFLRWAEAHPHHALPQKVAAETLALNSKLLLTTAERNLRLIAVAENAYRLMCQLPEYT